MSDVGAGVCCDRCPRATSAQTSRFARRRILKAAVFQPSAQGSATGSAAAPGGGPRPGTRQGGTGHGPAGPGSAPPGLRVPGRHPGERPASSGSAGLGTAALDPEHYADPQGPAGTRAERALPRAVSGRIVDVSPHFIAIGDSRGERRYALTAEASAWRGGPLDVSALSPGDHAVLRLHPSRHRVADRVWANIGRVTGTIVQRDGDSLLVDEGATRDKQVVVIPERAMIKIQVRFPQLQPGFLIDVIGLRRRGVLEGLIPATSQPPYSAANVPVPRPASGHFTDAVAGCVTWHDSRDEPHGLLGVSYPAIDPDCGCAELAREPAHGYRRMPYLAVGSVLRVTNECTGASRALAVTGCAPIARLFGDRCVTCGTSARGRIADLTLASFVALGGELEQGCFNGTIAIGS